MADLNYAVGVNTTGAVRSLDDLQKKVKTSTGAFDGLKKAVAGLAVAAFVRSSFQMANAMTDLSAATNVSVKSLVGFGHAVAANGGNIQRSQDAIKELTKRMGEAQQGSTEAVASFQRVGVSLQDIYTLSEEDILRKVVDSLGKMDSPSKRAAASMKIFSEAVKGVDFVGLNNGLDNYTQRSAGYAAAVERAGQVNQSLKNIMEELRVKLLLALDPFTRLAEALVVGETRVKSWGESWAVFAIRMAAVVAIGAVFTRMFSGVALMIRGLWRSVKTLGNAFRHSGAIIKQWRDIWKDSVTVAGGFTKKVSEAWKTLAAFLKIDAVPFGEMITRIFATAGVAIYAFKDNINNAFTSIGKTFDNLFDGWRQRAREMGFLPTRQIEMMASHSADATAEFIKQREAAAKMAEYVGVLDVGFSKALDTYKQQNAETIKGLELTKKMIGMTSEQAEEYQTIDNFTKRHTDELAVLNERVKLLTDSQGDHTAEIALTKQAALDLTAAYNEQLPRVKELAEQIAAKRKEVEKELEAAAELKRLAEETADAIKSSSSFMEELAESTQDARDAFNDLDMNDFEKSIVRTERRIKNNLAKEIKKLNDIRTSDNAAEIDKQVAALTKAADEAISKQEQLAAKSYQHQRTFSYGWKKAFEQYKDDATNSAKSAERIFSKTTQGIEDMIVNLAKTGKFEWKDFAASILEELLRTQIKILTADIFGQATNTGANTAAHVLGNTANGAQQQGGQQQQSSGGGLLSSIAGLFGGGQQQADNRTPGANPSAGGGLLSSIGNLFSGGSSNQNTGSRNTGYGMGSASSSLQAAQASQGSGVWNAVKSVGSSVAKGIGSLFGGFFADGGHLPKGKFGIVGERGPEMISGPANITPFTAGGGGGTTNVTYNISAVDAPSFQALVARDPGFIHAIAMKGGSSTPSRR